MLELSAGDLSLGLVPEAGGAIAWLTVGGLDVLRRGDPTIDPTAAACFPLVPYSGPVVGGRFRYEGGEHRLEHNHPNEPEPIHGEGWVVPWELVDFTSTTATLRYRHVARPGTFPFVYEAEQRFALDADGLTIAMSVTNRATGRCPPGSACIPTSRTGVVCGSSWLQPACGHAILSTAPVRRSCRYRRKWNFASRRPARDLVVDDLFLGWGGRARLDWPERGLTVEIAADPVFGFVQLFSTADEDFLCVEPVSNANDGFNLCAAGIDGHGVRVVGPGDRLAGQVRLACAMQSG